MCIRYTYIRYTLRSFSSSRVRSVYYKICNISIGIEVLCYKNSGEPTQLDRIIYYFGSLFRPWICTLYFILNNSKSNNNVVCEKGFNDGRRIARATDLAGLRNVNINGSLFFPLSIRSIVRPQIGFMGTAPATTYTEWWDKSQITRRRKTDRNCIHTIQNIRKRYEKTSGKCLILKIIFCFHIHIE